MKSEAIAYADTLLLIINIYDKRTIDNIKAFIEEINSLLNNISTNTNANNTTQSIISNNKNKKLNCICLLLSCTNNFLDKLTEKKITDILKRELNSFGITRFLEINDIAISEMENFLNELIKFFI